MTVFWYSFNIYVIRSRKKACERDAHFLRSEFYFSTCDDDALELPNTILYYNVYIVCCIASTVQRK